MNGFTEALRQEVTQRYVRVGVLEPGGVATELGSHNTPKIRDQMIDPFYQQTEVLAPEDIADGIAYLITRPATPRSANCGSCPPSKSDRIPAHRKSAKSRSIREPNSDSRSQSRTRHSIGAPAGAETLAVQGIPALQSRTSRQAGFAYDPAYEMPR